MTTHFIATKPVHVETEASRMSDYTFAVCQPVRWSTLLCAQSTRRRRYSCRTTPTARAGGGATAPKSEPSRAAKIVCIGDIHGQWDENDEAALRGLQPDLALFVGDYGNEDLRVTKRLGEFAASVDFGVATVFGNHDAHYTASALKRSRAPYDVATTCRVSEQMKLLAECDVSYRAAPFDRLALSVCGGRAFSFGGPNWKHGEFYRRFVGVSGLPDSAAKLAHAATGAPFSTLVFLSHSGPIGLGERPDDPCGKDWGSFPGGDYGDPDLRYAITEARAAGYRVPLTVFGHMHKRLQKGVGQRVMLKTEPDGCSSAYTVMLNAAVVPRHRSAQRDKPSLYNFQIVHMRVGGDVDSVEEAWVSSKGVVVETSVLFNSSTFVVNAEATCAATSSGL